MPLVVAVVAVASEARSDLIFLERTIRRRRDEDDVEDKDNVLLLLLLLLLGLQEYRPLLPGSSVELLLLLLLPLSSE